MSPGRTARSFLSLGAAVAILLGSSSLPAAVAVRDGASGSSLLPAAVAVRDGASGSSPLPAAGSGRDGVPPATAATLDNPTSAQRKADGSHDGTRTVSLSYQFTLKELPKVGALAQIWVPLPAENAHQKLNRYELKGGYKAQVVTEPEYGNRYLRIDLPLARSEAGGGPTVALEFNVARSAYRAEQRGAIDRTSQDLLRRFLSPDRLVPIDGTIEKDAKSAAGGARSPLELARRLYDHIVASMKYDKSGTDWGRGDALWACDARRGNCTDFHSLFIGEARAMKLPARFIMGLPLPEDRKDGPIAGYHCWAEFYIEGRGWVPIDASEAFKRPDKKEELFAGLDANRIQFTMGRDIKLPDSSGERLNYSIYPHVEIDGRPHTKVETTFSFREIEVESKSTAAAGTDIAEEQDGEKDNASKRNRRRRSNRP